MQSYYEEFRSKILKYYLTSFRVAFLHVYFDNNLFSICSRDSSVLSKGHSKEFKVELEQDERASKFNCTSKVASIAFFRLFFDLKNDGSKWFKK